MRSTKIIATLGPASSDEAVIGALADAGVNVFRLNFSHGTHAEKLSLIEKIRKIEQDKEINIAILADLQGPKLRIGDFDLLGGGSSKGEHILRPGDKVKLILADSSEDPTVIPIPHKEIFAVLNETPDKTQEIFMNDGQILLTTLGCSEDLAEAEVLTGGKISSRKGINLPHKYIPIPALTDKDIKDLQFACENGADWVALSFVQRAEDLLKAEKYIKGRAKIMAKLEKSDAIDNLERILQHCDAVMVARGDLGIETPMYNVPQLQKHIIRQCRKRTLPVVVATQMLDSMVQNSVPTRAEVNDVANAVYDGADAVMLSAESAVGDYPAEAVKVMHEIIVNSESDEYYREARLQERRLAMHKDSGDIIAASAIDIGERIPCKAVATFTTTGMTGIRAASLRSHVPLVCLTPHKQVARQLALVWGAHPVKTRDDVHSFDDMVGKSTRLTRAHGFTRNGDKIVVTAGVPFGQAGSTNIIRVCTVGEHEKS